METKAKAMKVCIPLNSKDDHILKAFRFMRRYADSLGMTEALVEGVVHCTDSVVSLKVSAVSDDMSA